ncbi:MAG: DUF3018 family protein [Halothiobacillaceae bacterium]|nr:MAG: DUF3018 family protein [Halothiobacillaceae bacterium]
MPVPVQQRVEKRRHALREAGLRPVQIWVPDTRRPGFADECKRQSMRLTDDPQEPDILKWIESATDIEGWA